MSTKFKTAAFRVFATATALTLALTGFAPEAHAAEATVSTQEELRTAIDAEDVTKISLASDITMTGAWVPAEIASGRALVIEGNGHSIIDMHVPYGTLLPNGTGIPGDGGSCDYNCGFIGNTAGEVTIQNLVFDSAEVDINPISSSLNSTGSSIIGTVVGNNTGTLELNNVSVENSVARGYSKVGGLVGFTQGGKTTIERCTIKNTTVVCEADGNDSEAGFSGLIVGYDGNNLVTTKGVLIENSKTEVDDSVQWGCEIQTSASGLRYVDSGGTKYGITCETYTDDGYGMREVTFPVSINGYGYESLADAVEEAQDGDTITLDADVELTEIVILDGKSLTLDLNGKTVTNTKNIWDNNINWSLVSLRNGASLVVNGEGTMKAKENDCYVFDIQGSPAEKESQLIVNSGTFVGNISAIYLGGKTGESYSKATVTINGGDFFIQQLSKDGGYNFLLNCLDPFYKNGTFDFVVNGGTFHGFNPGDNAAEGVGTNFLGYGAVVEANDQTTPATYTVKQAERVAQVGDQAFVTVADAVAAAKDGETVKLLKDTTGEYQTHIQKKLTLDLNGKQLSFDDGRGFRVKDGELALTDMSGEKDGVIKVAATDSTDFAIALDDGGAFIMNGGTIDAADYGVFINKNADAAKSNKAIINGGYIKSANGINAPGNGTLGTTQVEVHGGKIEGSNAGIITNGKVSNGGTKITMTGGEVLATGELSTGIYIPGIGGETVITGGTVTGATGIEVRAGSLKISGNATVSGTGAFSAKSNSSGATTTGVGIAAAQYGPQNADGQLLAPPQPINVTVSDGVKVDGHYAFYEWNAENNSTENLAKIVLSINGGTFVATGENPDKAVESKDCTKFITGGKYSISPDAALVADGYTALEDADGMYEVVKQTVAPEDPNADAQGGVVMKPNEDLKPVITEDSAENLADKAEGVAQNLLENKGMAGVIVEDSDKIEEVAKTANNTDEAKLVATLSFEVELLTKETVPQEDATLVENGKSSCETTSYLDLSVMLNMKAVDKDGKLLSSAASEVTSLDTPLKITVSTLDADLSGSVRVARIHDGAMGIIPSSVNRTDKTVTFETGLFSTYALLTSGSAEVTFDSNGGSAVEKQQVKFGTKVTKPTDPTLEGYTFKGWYTSRELTTPFDFDVAVAADTPVLTLFAKWEKNVYTIKFNTNGGIPLDDRKVEHGETFTVPTTTRAGYSLTGWAYDKGTTRPGATSSPVTSNLTFNAEWKLNAPTVSISASSSSPHWGETAVLTAHPSHALEGVAYEYQWFNDDAAVDGATGETYTVSETGTYSVKVIAKFGTDASDSSSSVAIPVDFKNWNGSISFTDKSVEKHVNDDPFTIKPNIVFYNVEEPTYTSSDTSVATVDGSGTVTILAPGTTTITAEIRDTEHLDGNKGSYTLTVSDHEGEKWGVVKPASCTEKGLEHKLCTICGEEFATREIPALGHELIATPPKPATCTEPGNNAYWICGECNQVFSDKDGKTVTTVEEQIIPAPGHDFGDWAVTTSPTCTEKGVETRSCTTCGHKETRELEPLGHKLAKVDGKPATCTDAGVAEHYRCDREGCGALFSDAAGQNPVTADDLIIKPLGHRSDEGTAVEAPTCTEEGSKEYRCTECGALLKTESIPALGHELVATPAKPATCTESGNNAYWTCSACDRVFSDADGKDETTVEEQSIPASGHDFGDWAVTTSPTCTEKGEETRSCATCGLEETRELEPLGHKLAKVDGKPDTCTDAGVAEHYRCDHEGCGALFWDAGGKDPVTSEDDLVLDASGHSWGEWDVTTDPTCTTKGEETRSCATCGLEEARELEPLGHKLAKVDGKPATCTDTGVNEHYKCDREDCGALFSDADGQHSVTADELVVQTLGHKLAKVPAVEPTAEAEGNKEYWECDACGALFWDAKGTDKIDSKDETIIPKLKVYKVTFDDCLKSTEELAVFEVVEGRAFSDANKLPAGPECKGYEFKGWFHYDVSAKEWGEEFDPEKPVADDLYIAAKWEKLPSTDDGQGEQDQTEKPTKPGDSLAQTGDTSAAPIVVLGAVGAAVIMAGVIISRKNKK